MQLKKDAVVLGIETSCDETAVGIVKGGRKILADEIISSAAEHVRFGGVVPEIASRAHTEAVLEATKRALGAAGMSFGDIDAIAVTYGAGLLGALLVGVSFAKGLAYALDKPLVAVNHIRGHIAAAYLADEALEPPFVTLLASGGHTAVIRVKDYLGHEVLGSTLDDAAGEAFDKTARVLGLEYPGGPNVEKLARQGKNVIKFPAMLKGSHTYDFSYSGLKTSVVNYVHSKRQKGEAFSAADVAASFQSAALDVLAEKLFAAARAVGAKTVTAGGGVSANGYLRELLSRRAEQEGVKLVLPERRYCTDNACMIAAEGYVQYINGNFAGLDLNAKASIPLRNALNGGKNNDQHI